MVARGGRVAAASSHARGSRGVFILHHLDWYNVRVPISFLVASASSPEKTLARTALGRACRAGRGSTGHGRMCVAPPRPPTLMHTRGGVMRIRGGVMRRGGQPSERNNALRNYRLGDQDLCEYLDHDPLRQSRWDFLIFGETGLGVSNGRCGI